MTVRTLVFTEEIIARLRGTLVSTLGAEEYWQSLSPMRLRFLLATVQNPEFCREYFSDEVAAVKAWAHDRPPTVEPQAIYQLASLFCQLVAAEQAQSDPDSIQGITTFIEKLDQEILPARLSKTEDRPLVIVLRGLSGSGKSTLAEILHRSGVGDHEVGWISGDVYHCKLGNDENNRSIYRTETGQLEAVEPILADDPVAAVRSILWHEAFRQDFEQLAQTCSLVVVDGGYGELLLDKLGIPASQRLVIEISIPSGRRFARVRGRVSRFQTPANSRVRVMNDMVLAMGWHAVLLENNADPEWVVTPAPDESLDAVLHQRETRTGRSPAPHNDRKFLLRQVNIAREPGTAELSSEELNDFLREAFSPANLPLEALAQKGPVELHGMLPQALRATVSLPQFQRLLRYRLDQLDRAGESGQANQP